MMEKANYKFQENYDYFFEQKKDMYAKMRDETKFLMVSDIEQTPGAYLLKCEVKHKVTKASLLLQ